MTLFIVVKLKYFCCLINQFRLMNYSIIHILVTVVKGYNYVAEHFKTNI